jgi:hypothetical protein
MTKEVQKPKKWTEESTESLKNFVGGESPVTQATVAEAAKMLETSTRSVAAKLRKLNYEVAKVETTHVKSFSDEQEEALAEFLNDNAGEYTFAEIAEKFEGGAFTAKQIQGKVLSMELTDKVKKAPKREYERSFSSAEEKTFVDLVKEGASLEKIGGALKREVAVIRGKALSLLRTGEIASIPRSEKVAVEATDPLATLDVSTLTVAEIADKLDRSERGIKTMLTRRGLSAKDYDGAGKREKRDAKATAA